jgi:uncharacterized RDD family membrane protein YckC
MGMAICVVFFEPLVRIGDWGRLIGFPLAMAYAAWFDARGGTPGKLLLKIRVAIADGRPPGLRRALIRNVIRIGPWFVLTLPIRSRTPFQEIVVSVPAALYVASLLLVAFDESHQAVHDRAAGTYVLPDKAAAPVPAPGSLRSLTLGAVPFVVVAALPFFLRTPARLVPLIPIQEAVERLPSHPAVSVNDNTLFLRGGGRARILQVGASFIGPQQEVAAFGREVADAVLRAHPDLSPYDAVQVVVRRQAVLGIGFFSKNHMEPVSAGKKKPGAR